MPFVSFSNRTPLYDIAHGYFDINTDFVWDVVQNDLEPLLEAIEYFIKNIYDIVPFEKE